MITRELIVLAKANDSNAVGVLMTDVRKYLLSKASQWKVKGCTSEDLVQEGLLEVWAELPTLSGNDPAMFLSWVSTMAFRTWSAMKRDSRAAKRDLPLDCLGEDVTIEMVAVDDYSPVDLSDKELYAKTIEILSQESERNQKVVLAYAAGKPCIENGKALGMSPWAVGGVLKRFKAKAREFVNE